MSFRRSLSTTAQRFLIMLAAVCDAHFDVAAWDEEPLVDSVSVGPYHAYMKHAMEQWKELLKNGTPVFAYVNCSPHTGQYLGPAEYRAAAANAYGAAADGVYLFNYPCLFELALQQPTPPEAVKIELPDLRSWRQGDFSKVGQVLNEIGNANALLGKNKHFLFYFNEPTGYRHHVRERLTVSQLRDARLVIPTRTDPGANRGFTPLEDNLLAVLSGVAGDCGRVLGIVIAFQQSGISLLVGLGLSHR